MIEVEMIYGARPGGRLCAVFGPMPLPPVFAGIFFDLMREGWVNDMTLRVRWSRIVICSPRFSAHWRIQAREHLPRPTGQRYYVAAASSLSVGGNHDD
jgi:hypothetical protein